MVKLKEYKGDIENCCYRKCKKLFKKGQEVLYGEITEDDGKTIKEVVLFCHGRCMLHSGRDDPVYESEPRIFIGA